MKNRIILLGIIDKKLIWPFLYSITQILQTIFNHNYPKDKQSESMNSFGTAIGQILNLVIPYIIKYKMKRREKKCNKKNVLHYFLLLLFNGAFYGLVAYNRKTMEAESNPHDSTFCTKEAIEIIFITLITFIFLKYRYFIHHIISLVIFSFISVSIDFLIDGFQENFINKTTIQKILEVNIILLEVLNYCYQKYMMDKLYHHYWNLNKALGLFLFIGLLTYKFTSYEEFIKEFENVGIGYIILSFLINVILGFATHLARILTLDYLTPNHMLIAYDINKVFIVLNQSENSNKWYSIFLFLLQFFFLMFYLEILEFNFCNLNKNTKRNVDLRIDNEKVFKEIKDINDSKSERSDSFDIEGYIMRKENKDNLEFEMSSEACSKKDEYEIIDDLDI